jgi:hypothetical protein
VQVVDGGPKRRRGGVIEGAGEHDHRCLRLSPDLQAGSGHAVAQTGRISGCIECGHGAVLSVSLKRHLVPVAATARPGANHPKGSNFTPRGVQEASMNKEDLAEAVTVLGLEPQKDPP